MDIKDLVLAPAPGLAIGLNPARVPDAVTVLLTVTETTDQPSGVGA